MCVCVRHSEAKGRDLYINHLSNLPRWKIQQSQQRNLTPKQTDNLHVNNKTAPVLDVLSPNSLHKEQVIIRLIYLPGRK